MKKVLPFNRHGGWTNHHDFFYEQAKIFLEKSSVLKIALEKQSEELNSKYSTEEPSWDENTVNDYVEHLTDDESNNLDAICIMSQMFACMAVEAFLNYYGVRRLGEDYYKRNLERLGINQKLEILIAICTQDLLEDKEEITSIMKRMFDRRNRLAHPKSKEIFKKGQVFLPEFIDHLEQAELSVNEMVSFFDIFKEIDKSIELGKSIVTCSGKCDQVK